MRMLEQLNMYSTEIEIPLPRKHPALIPRGRSRSWARPWTRSRARGGALLPRLGPPIVWLGRRGARGRFDDVFSLPVLYWGGRATAGLLFAARLLGSTAGIALGLYEWAALWAGLALDRTGARPGLLGAWTRLWFVGSGAGPARLRFAFSRLSSRPRAGTVAVLVAARTRPVGQIGLDKITVLLVLALEACRSLTESGTLSGFWSSCFCDFHGSCCGSGGDCEI